jgi:DNA-binding transcriptional MerR regulator
MMKIGEFSRKSGLSVHTIRYYEKIGLLKKKSKDSSGHGNYSERDMEWISFIVCLKSTEMSLDDILNYIGLIEKGESTASDRLAILKEQRIRLEEKIASLTADLGHIDYKIRNFDKFFRKIQMPS